MPSFSPSADPVIERRYSVGTLEHKAANKIALQQELGWPEEEKRAIVCLPAGMTDQLGGSLLKDLLPGLLSLPIEILVIGKGSPAYGTLFTKLQSEQKHRLHILKNTEEQLRKMYAASDMTLFLSEATGQRELLDALRYGVVPIALAHKGSPLEDYNPVQESGNAFLYEQENHWGVFASLVRALETFKFPFDWRTIQRHCMESIRER